MYILSTKILLGNSLSKYNLGDVVIIYNYKINNILTSKQKENINILKTNQQTTKRKLFK